VRDDAYIDTRGFDAVDAMLAETFLEAYKSPDDTVMEVSFFFVSCDYLLRNSIILLSFGLFHVFANFVLSFTNMQISPFLLFFV